MNRLLLFTGLLLSAGCKKEGARIQSTLDGSWRVDRHLYTTIDWEGYVDTLENIENPGSISFVKGDFTFIDYTITMPAIKLAKYMPKTPSPVGTGEISVDGSRWILYGGQLLDTDEAFNIDKSGRDAVVFRKFEPRSAEKKTYRLEWFCSRE